jgi:hypothetical protein
MASFVKFGDFHGLKDAGQPLPDRFRTDAGATPDLRTFIGGHMTKRGQILRDTNPGPGLISIDGEHHQFTLEGVWRSDAPPTPGMQVTVEFAPDLRILSITAVSESQIAKEEAEAVWETFRAKCKAIFHTLVAKFGLPTLVAIGLLIVGWFFLSSLSIQDARVNLTFWQLLGLLNSSSPYETIIDPRGTPGAGIYGFLAMVALAGPLVHYFWKDKRAILGGSLPLLFMVAMGLMVRASIAGWGGANLANIPPDVAQQLREEALKGISMGWGAYLSGLVGLYFAAIGAKQFLLARAVDTEVPARSNQAAA